MSTFVCISLSFVGFPWKRPSANGRRMTRSVKPARYRAIFKVTHKWATRSRVAWADVSDVSGGAWALTSVFLLEFSTTATKPTWPM